MTHVVKAGAEELIWIVVGIFWVIAQIAGSSKKKMAPPRPRNNDEGEQTVEDPFADLMSKLSGVQEFKIPEPPKPVEKTVDAVSPPRPQPTQKNAVRTPRLQKETPVPKPEPAIEIAEVDVRPTMNAFRNSLPAMKLPSMKLHFQCAPHHDRDVDSGKDIGRIDRLGLKDRATFRRAMLSHIILGKPKAMEQWNSRIVE